MVLTPNNLEAYAKKNKVNLSGKSQFLSSNALKLDKDGNLLFTTRDYCDSDIDVRKYNYCKKWILLRNWKMALIKNRIPDKENEGKYSQAEKEILITNNFLMPILASVFQVESAEYYNARFNNRKDKDFNPNQIYLVSPSFLRRDDELIHLANIAGEKEFRASTIISKIQEWLRLRKCPETDIERTTMDFIKQTIFNRFIDFSDEHNLNAGIIVSSNEAGITRAKMAPSYDTDYSAGVYNQMSTVPIVHMRMTDKGQTDLESMIMQFKDLPWMKQYLKEVISNINIPEALSQALQNGNTKLSEAAQKRYTRFFDRQTQELKQAYEKAYGRDLEER